MPVHGAVGGSQAGRSTRHTSTADVVIVTGWGGSVGGGVAVGAVETSPTNCVPVRAGVVDGEGEGDDMRLGVRV